MVALKATSERGAAPLAAFAQRRTQVRGAQAEALGRALARSRRCGSVLVTDLNLITSREEAEVVLEEATLAYGSPIEGHCLAATTSSCARLLSCDAPLAAPMFAADRIADGGILPVTPSLIGVGAELHFRFGRAFPTMGDDPASLDSIRDAIVTCHIGLQILGRRSGHGTPAHDWTALADFGLAAYHVRGKPLADWDRLDLRVLEMALLVDGHKVASGHGGDALGDPFAALSWRAADLKRRGSYIEANTNVAIGSCTGLSQIVAGHVYTGRIGAGHEVSFTAR